MTIFAPETVVIHLVAQAGVAVRVQAHHAVEIHRGSVGVNDTNPADLNAILSVRNSRVISSDQAGALRDEKVEARSSVVDVWKLPAPSVLLEDPS